MREEATCILGCWPEALNHLGRQLMERGRVRRWDSGARCLERKLLTAQLRVHAGRSDDLNVPLVDAGLTQHVQDDRRGDDRNPQVAIDADCHPGVARQAVDVVGEWGRCRMDRRSPRGQRRLGPRARAGSGQPAVPRRPWRSRHLYLDRFQPKSRPATFIAPPCPHDERNIDCIKVSADGEALPPLVAARIRPGIGAIPASHPEAGRLSGCGPTPWQAAQPVDRRCG